MAETSYASCDDLSLAYQVFGDGPVELVYAGSFVSHVELFWALPQFKAFFDQLATFCRVLLFDKAGVGLSDPVPKVRTQRFAPTHTVDSLGRPAKKEHVKNGALHRRRRAPVSTTAALPTTGPDGSAAASRRMQDAGIHLNGWTGRIEAAVRYADAGQIVLGRSREALPFGAEGALGGVYLAIGQSERSAELCRAQLARRRDTHVHIRNWLVAALSLAGSGGEAMDSADGLIEAAEATGNPSVLAIALFAYGLAFRGADPVGALNAVGRGLMIAQDSGNRANESVLANVLALAEAEHGDTVSAFDHLTLAIRNFHNGGDTTTIRVPLAILATLFDRLGRYEPAATIAGFALSPFSASAVPEITTAITHLRDVLGDQTYESLARKGETMTTAAMVTYAYDQIDQARTELEQPS